MVDIFNKILDECIDRINHGQSVESCLADYPSYAEQLEPLLRYMLQTKKAYTFVPIERVQKAMEQLTLEQREVLSLRFFGEFTSKETGGILSKTDGAVREMQRAATEKLRSILATD